MPDKAGSYRVWLKEKARELGFSYCGISQAAFLEEEAPRMEKWLRQGHQGKMSYLENYFDKRLDPRLLVPGTKSVVSLLFNYFPPETQEKEDVPKISKYAYGRDYHKVIRSKLAQLLLGLQQQAGEVQGRVFVDSAPVMERAWAARSGAGWIGKHTLLISKGAGSYFFLAEMMLDIELEPDGPVKDYCGSCTACIDACPTQAIKPYFLEAEKCISYLTIELKEQIPSAFEGKMGNWAFGCDICQEVCPWNRFSRTHQEPDFMPRAFLSWNKTDWSDMTEELFEKTFRGTPLKRAGFEKIKKTLTFLSGDHR
jgi:epoxyqueuosine reductase